MPANAEPIIDLILFVLEMVPIPMPRKCKIADAIKKPVIYDVGFPKEGISPPCACP